MSIVRRCSNLRQSNEDVVACLEQKNNVINLLQMEVDELRENQERYDRAKEHLFRIKSNYESLLREFDCEKDRNQEKQDLLAKNVSDLKLQIDHLENDLKVKNLALQEAKFGCQQLMALESRKEDETAEMEIKLQEQKGLAQFRKMEQERTRLQIVQLKEEVERQKRENVEVREQTESVSEKSHKTQSYIRNLLREQTNLNQNLTRIQDENNNLDSSINKLQSLIGSNNTAISTTQKNCQELQFFISSKELEKKRVENEIREKVKQLSAQRQRLRSLQETLDERKNDGYRLDCQLKESNEEINFIIGKNNEIFDVNMQLKDDLKVCKKHLENVCRVNRQVENELVQIEEGSLMAIKKMQAPISNRASQGAKWTCASWRTGADTAEAELFKERNY